MLKLHRGNHVMGTLSLLNTKRLFLKVLQLVYLWLSWVFVAVHGTGSSVLRMGFLYLQ